MSAEAIAMIVYLVVYIAGIIIFMIFMGHIMTPIPSIEQIREVIREELKNSNGSETE